MSYSSIVDVRNALTPGADASDQTTASILEDSQIQDAINEADSVILAYIGADYSVPQDPNDTLVAVAPVRWWSRDIAGFLATLTYKRNKDVTTDDPVRLRYNMVMSMLTAIRDGKGSVDLPPADPDAGDGDVTVINLYTGDLWGPADFGLSAAGNPFPTYYPYGG